MNKIHFFILYVLIIGLAGWFYYSTATQANPVGEVIIKNEATGQEQRVSVPEFTRVKLFDTPQNLTFAGEAVPLDQQDILERLEREIYVNAYWNSNTILTMKRAGKFFPIIEPILEKHNIPNDFKYVALVESGLMNVVSPAGARGFWQFMESTGKELNLEISNEVDERYHLEKSTEAACRYLKKAYGRFGNWTSVAASYNMGITGLSKRKNEQLMPNYYSLLLNEETSRYVFRILAFKELFENPDMYGYELQEQHFYKMPKLREIMVDDSINDLAKWSVEQNSSYKDLKTYNPWLRTNKLSVKKGRQYTIKLPA
ncbi:lytic transglycosylase domain-containing protein [Litoribacter populi]|uniref:lytic transglycosylase domain-containing protein n=1 Tax=Litoribacter populi TaxID=2598460 RepID=UPI00117F3473|nr:lytic transglycosylase domain-containing protein [Litoribacter populi]